MKKGRATVSGTEAAVAPPRKLRMGMVGGGRRSLIGPVHWRASRLDGGIELVAGALSSTPEKSRLSAKDYHIPRERAYDDWEAMLAVERRLRADERMDFVTIVTPNHLHYRQAGAFVEAGFGVVVDKPMVLTSQEADRLIELVEAQDVVFAVTYTYTGYPMVKQAREMVRRGDLGEVRKIVVDYPQDWLRTRLEAEGNKQAVWRTDPSRAGAGGSIGDIGTHAENLVSTITGLEIVELCADLTSFVEGRTLDDDANVLLRFGNGARGVLMASQICTGQQNGLNIRVWGTEGGLSWRQEQPNTLTYWPGDGTMHVLSRGQDNLCTAAERASRLPPGHPEGFIEAFANIYRNVADTIRAKKHGREPTSLELDFPTVYEGARGITFVETVVASSRQGQWISVRRGRGAKPYGP
ncbi:MAG: Gfo/Idh/MocA family oxidoreductase [Anaerolineae bacterium]